MKGNKLNTKGGEQNFQPPKQSWAVPVIKSDYGSIISVKG